MVFTSRVILALESSAFANFMTTAALLATFGFFVRIAEKETEEAEKKKKMEEEKEGNEEEKKPAKQVRLLTADGIAFRLSGAALFLGIREKLAGPVSGLVRTLRKGSAAANFPSAESAMETPRSIQLFAIAGLFYLASFLIREAEETEKEEDETEETEEKKEKTKKKSRKVNLLAFDGVLRRFAVGTFFMAVREVLAPAMMALLTRARAGAASFPASGMEMEASSFVQLLAVSVLLATFAHLLEDAAQEEERSQKEEEKEAKKKIEILTLTGFARRLSAGTLLLSLRELYLSGSWRGAWASFRRVHSAAGFPPSGASLETPSSVCLLSLAALSWVFSLVVGSAKEEEKKKEEAKEEESKEEEAKGKTKTKIHSLVSVERIAKRAAISMGLAGISEAARGLSSILPSVMETVATPEVALGGGLLLLGTGLTLADRHSSGAKK